MTAMAEPDPASVQLANRSRCPCYVLDMRTPRRSIPRGALRPAIRLRRSFARAAGRRALLAWLVVGHGALASPAVAAPSAPIATLSEDVDGDGAPDAIELGGDGVVRIAARPRGEVKLATAIAEGRLAVARYRGKAYVVARIVAATAAPRGPAAPTPAMQDGEAVILSADGGGWREVLRVPLGGVGLDHDYGIDVDVTPDAIYRFQTRRDIRRCDG
jgi:hypothetical protein